MEDIKATYELKEKATLKQLNERLEIIGDNGTVDQLVNQTKALHAQVFMNLIKYDPTQSRLC